MTVKSEIDRLKQNVADAYQVLENQEVVIQDDNSDYLDDNMTALYSNMKAVALDEYATVEVDLDDCTIIDVTRVNVETEDTTFTANGTYNPPTGKAGFGTVTVDVDVNNEERTFTQNGTYYPSAGKNGIGKAVVALNVGPKSAPITTSGTYYSADDGGLGGWTQVDVQYALNNENITVTQNGTYTKSSSTYDGLGTVQVALPLDSKTIQHNGTYNASSDNLEGFTSVNVQVPIDAKPAVITRNGTYSASQDSLDGYSSVQVVYDSHNQDITVNQNGTYTCDAGYDGLGEVTVNFNVGPKPLTITANDTYYSSADNLSGYSSVVVDVDVNNENRTFTANGTYYPSTGKNGMYEVVVNTPYQGYLDDIKTALTNMGLTPPADYADLDTFITTAFNDIHNSLSNIHGED